MWTASTAYLHTGEKLMAFTYLGTQVYFTESTKPKTQALNVRIKWNNLAHAISRKDIIMQWEKQFCRRGNSTRWEKTQVPSVYQTQRQQRREPKLRAQLSVIHNNPLPGPHTLQVLVTHMLDSSVYLLEGSTLCRHKVWRESAVQGWFRNRILIL